jgi:oxygen-independent coproporphyrinogen-3 oxidase
MNNTKSLLTTYNTKNTTSLYIHIPYCRNICDYCSFTVVRGNRVPDDYIQALKKDWSQSIKVFEGPIKLNTIYFGGGTPSLLSNGQLKDLVDFFLQWKAHDSIEITMESNPTSLLPAKLSSWLDSGVNRISMGIQSFSKETLKYLTRTHSPELSKKAVQILKSSGVKSFNIDLIYGMSTQSVDEFAEDLHFLLEQHPNHISAYELTIEENTPFHANGQKPRLDDDIAEMMEILSIETAKYGIHRYEISNYAQEGHRSQHNINYWKNLSYVGIGCGAFSYLNRNRFSKEKNPDIYVKKILENADVIDFSEQLDNEKYARETLVVGLRMIDGISINDFFKQTGFNAIELMGSKFAFFQKSNLIEIENDKLSLTKKGICVANSILSEFI